MEAKSAVVNAVLALVNSVNRGDFTTVVEAFTDAPVIIEDISPYIWRGTEAPTAWLSAMGANAARLNVQSVEMTLEDPTRVEADEEVAYALLPGQLRLAAPGANLVASGMLTLILRCTAGRWLIDSLVWSGPEPAPS